MARPSSSSHPGWRSPERQVRSLEAAVATGEWRLVVDSAFGGAGGFTKGARLVVDFAIDTTGEHTLDARATVQDGEDNGALRKMQAVQEAVLRRSFVNGLYFDQVLWSILDTDRRQAKAVWGPKVH